MEKKFQIFVSSTYEDLKEERRVAIEQILNLGHIPVGMELFQASDEDQWNHIKSRIDDCDYYIVIIAERYGSQRDGKSYTQMEYEYAVEKKIPVCAFLLEGRARELVPAMKTEYEQKKKIDDFRKIAQNKLVKFWTNKDDLAAKITTTLALIFKNNPRVGWVKADQVATASTLEEISRLSQENYQLRHAIEALSLEKEFNSIPAKTRFILEKLNNIEILELNEKKLGDYPLDASARINISACDFTAKHTT